jgi:hypothetical protein
MDLYIIWYLEAQCPVQSHFGRILPKSKYPGIPFESGSIHRESLPLSTVVSVLPIICQESLHNSNKQPKHLFPMCCTDNTLSISPDSEDSPGSNLGKQYYRCSVNVWVQSLSPKLLGTKPVHNLHCSIIEILIVVWNLSSMIVCQSLLLTRTRPLRNGRRCKRGHWHESPGQNMYYPLEQSGSRPARRYMNLVFGNVQTVRRLLRWRQLFSGANRQRNRVVIANLVRAILN